LARPTGPYRAAGVVWDRPPGLVNDAARRVCSRGGGLATRLRDIRGRCLFDFGARFSTSRRIRPGFRNAGRCARFEPSLTTKSTTHRPPDRRDVGPPPSRAEHCADPCDTSRSPYTEVRLLAWFGADPVLDERAGSTRSGHRRGGSFANLPRIRIRTAGARATFLPHEYGNAGPPSSSGHPL